jgi:serine/threonine-protein kinase RsbW
MTQRLDIPIKNSLDEFSRLVEGVAQFLAENEVSPKVDFTANLVIEEAVLNVIHYAYESQGEDDIGFTLQIEGRDLTITLTDSGRPYDPLSRPDPDVNAPLEDRQVGGLGVHLIKKTCKSVSYVYENQQNKLVMVIDLDMK